MAGGTRGAEVSQNLADNAAELIAVSREAASQNHLRVLRMGADHKVLFRHALPNVMTVALTTAGLLLSGLLGGAMVVENVFAWPGLGTAVVQAVLVRDYPVVQGVVLLLGTMVVLINTVVDLAVGLIDPRSLIRQA